MNRRKFLEALAGIPLLGLLVKLLEAEEGVNLIFPGDPDYIDVTVGNEDGLQLIMPGDPDYVDVSVDSPVGKLIFCGPYFGMGDDANDGCTPETAVATYRKALSLASTPRQDWVLTIGQDENGEYYRDLELV